ncbi:MAG: DUF2298 domain-containing protein [Haloarculaceae archaeon]
MEFGLVALWLVAYLSLLVVGAPLASTLFPRFADRGTGVALPLALAVLFVPGYLLGHLSLSLSLWAALVLLLFAVGTVSYRGATVDATALKRTTAVFTVAFLFLIAVRAVDPGIHPYAGEKFLDYGLVQSLLRAHSLPPADFWYAGERVMYYYGGHMLVAFLTRLTGTAPNYAYNLALAGWYATYVTAAYGVAGSIAARDDTFDGRAAALGAFFVGFASNLMTPLRLLLLALPLDVARPIAKALAVWTGRTRNPGNLIRGIRTFHSWDASAAIGGTINEFPLFAWMNGDLHGHMMAPSFTLLLVAVLYAYSRTPSANRRRRLALLVGVVPPLGGLLAVVNTWSFPAVAGLTALALVFSASEPRTLLPRSLADPLDTDSRVLAEVRRIGLAVAVAAVVAAGGVVWSLPFWLANVSSRSLAFLPDRSSLPALFVVHGAFLLSFALYLGYVAWARFGVSRRQLGAVAGAIAVLLALSAVGHVAAIGVVVPLLVGGYVLGRDLLPSGEQNSRNDGDSPTLPGFEVVLLLAGAGLVLVVEFVYLKERAGPGRFNTVFKTYAQVWAFWSVAAAVALGRLLKTTRLRVPTPRWRTGVRAFVVLLVVSTSVYGGFALVGHFGKDRPLMTHDHPTLDGTAYVSERHPDEAAAIAWLDAREGTPTIVTKPGRHIYRWTNAPSSLTGVPTILGWAHHERGFGRPVEDVQQRIVDVRRIYQGTPREQRALLADYDVRYVYVGPREREAYDVSVDRLDAVTRERRWGKVTIYAVNQSSLSS